MLVRRGVTVGVLAFVLSLVVGAGAAAEPTAQLAEQMPADDAVSLALLPLFTDLADPLFIANAGDGTNRIFIVGRWGTIWVAGGNLVGLETFLDITDIVRGDYGEQGLLGLAFAPDYAESGRFYIYYTNKSAQQVVARVHVSDNPNRGDSASVEPLLVMDDRAPNHNGGMLAFGPDGYLYIGTGDEGGGGDTYKNGQNLSTPLAKILRIDVDLDEGYAVPADNPFLDTPNALPEIWAYGVRNPWRFSFDRETGDLWIGDVGQSAWEEVNYQPAGMGAGANYGWSVMEGTHCFPAGVIDCDREGMTLPIAEYHHDLGCSITGGYVYRGTQQPLLAGKYLFGDLCSGRIWSINPAGDDWAMRELLNTEVEITGFGEDEAGELYLADIYEGVVYRLVSSDAIAGTWARTDQPVEAGMASRTWMWGPGVIAPALTETYREAPGGARTVQYFDKSRMEITDPEDATAGEWFVTNGLLVVEMVTQRIQVGDFTFENALPAVINVAGDPDDPNSPTYVTFGRLMQQSALDDGAPVIQRVDRQGTVTDDPELAGYGVTAAWRVSVAGIQHQVASPFWEFMTSSGTVWENGEYVDGALFLNPFYATGYPITEAYWADVQVAGVRQLVLIQCFERRCLTFTPGNPDGWQVEAGNVGQHYYRWRYPLGLE